MVDKNLEIMYRILFIQQFTTVLSLLLGNMVVVVPRGAAPGIIMLRNAQWPGMHLAVGKGGHFSVVSSRTELASQLM